MRNLQEQSGIIKICLEQNKIVQIQNNNYSWFYFVKSYSGRPEKDLFVRNFDSDTQMVNEEILK